MLIGVSGYSGSGKDTVGKIIQYLTCENVGSSTIEEVTTDHKHHEWWLEQQSGWEIKKWAGKLKTIASILTGIPVEKFEDQEFKKTYLGPEWDRFYSISPYLEPERVPMTVRVLLQRLGTDACRNGLHENVWVNALMADYTEESKWVITDTRFPNEAKAIKDRGGIIIRVNNNRAKPINPHTSETSLDDWKFDYTIDNHGDIPMLVELVSHILEEEDLIPKPKNNGQKNKS